MTFLFCYILFVFFNATTNTMETIHTKSSLRRQDHLHKISLIWLTPLASFLTETPTFCFPHHPPNTLDNSINIYCADMDNTSGAERTACCGSVIKWYRRHLASVCRGESTKTSLSCKSNTALCWGKDVLYFNVCVPPSHDSNFLSRTCSPFFLSQTKTSTASTTDDVWPSVLYLCLYKERRD